MKTWLALISWCVASVAWGADWQAGLTPSQPGKFPPLRPLVAHYEFGWGGVTAAEADFDFTTTEEGPLQLAMKTQTVGFARTLWRMDTRLQALCAPTTLRPISLEQTEIYRSDTEKTTVTYTDEAAFRKRESVPPGAKPAKIKRFKCPNLYDLHSALLFMRSQPLRDGDRYQFVVYPTTAAYLAKVTVVGRENIAGNFPQAIKLLVSLQQVTKDLQLVPHKKFKQAAVWISDDAHRLPVKIEADVFVGHVWGRLQTVTFTDRKP